MTEDASDGPNFNEAFPIHDGLDKPTSSFHCTSNTHFSDRSTIDCKPSNSLNHSEFNMVMIRVPMLLPGTKHAPRFRGKRLGDFLVTFEQMARNAGILDTEMPKHVLMYCTSSVRRVLKHDVVFEGGDWVKAKEVLEFWYPSYEDSARYSPDALRRFSKQVEKRQAVRSRWTLDRYACKFMAKTGNMVERARITRTERDMLFYKGLPLNLRKDLRVELEKAVGKHLTVDSPPDMRVVIELARQHYSPDDIDHESESDKDSDSDSDDSILDSESESDSDTGFRRKHKGKGAKEVKTEGKTKSKTGTPDKKNSQADAVARLLEEFEQLKIFLTQQASDSSRDRGRK